MLRRSPLLAALLTLLLGLTSCGVLSGGADDVHDGTVEPTDLALTPPTYAVGTGGKGMVLRSGDARLRLPPARAMEWLPGGRALIYVDAPGFTSRARIWHPANGDLGPPVTLWRGGEALVTPEPGSIKRSVTQVNVSRERLVRQKGRRPRVGEVLTAYDLDLKRRWQTALPGPDPIGDFRPRSLERGYKQGHTIDGITYLPWGDFHAQGAETEEHYGLLRVDADGEVLDQVQVNQRIVSMWLSADGASLLATRRTSGHPLGGCCAEELELVELDPATGEVVAEYGMPEEYDKSWDVNEVDKVGDRVAIRFTDLIEERIERDTEGEPVRHREDLRGTWIREGDDWSLLEGSKDEITWWQGPDDRIVARPARRGFKLVWLHGDEERPLPGRLSRRIGSVPGQALPPA